MTVWLAQYLCPNRHCIVACAAEAETAEAASEALLPTLSSHVAELIGSGTINPWCGLCEAPIASWALELGDTGFADLTAAEPPLRTSEREQAEVRRRFGG